MEVRKAVTGIAVERDVAKITIRGVKDRPGVAAAIFEPLAEAGISVDVIVQNVGDEGLADMTFTVRGADLQRSLEITRAARAAATSEVVAGTDLAKISIVGTGMQNAPGYASRMFRALADNSVNIEMITTSEIRITCLIDSDQIQAAARALHAAFELDTADE